MAVKEFNNLKPTAIHIKMNLTFFKIWRHGFPDFHLRKHLFNLTPSAVANSLTVAFWRNKKQIQISSISLDTDYNTTDNLSTIKDTVGFSTIYGFFNCLSRDDLTIFFKMVISKTKFL